MTATKDHQGLPLGTAAGTAAREHRRLLDQSVAWRILSRIITKSLPVADIARASRIRRAAWATKSQYIFCALEKQVLTVQVQHGSNVHRESWDFDARANIDEWAQLVVNGKVISRRVGSLSLRILGSVMRQLLEHALEMGLGDKQSKSASVNGAKLLLDSANVLSHVVETALDLGDEGFRYVLKLTVCHGSIHGRAWSWNAEQGSLGVEQGAGS